jgi:anthranilate synthase component 1
MRRVPIEDPPSPVALLEQLRDRTDAFLLQSAEGPRRLARYSFIGFDPKARLVIDDGQARLEDERLEGPPETALRRALDGHRTTDDDGYAFNGGLVGYLGYEYASLVEDVPRPEERQNGLGSFPEAMMGLFLDGVIYDHERRTCFYFTQAEDCSHRLPLDAARRDDERSHFSLGEVTTSHDEKAFGDMVRRVKDYIDRGHTFQTVVSRAFRAEFEGSPVRAYEALLEINPSPYMFYLSLAGTDVFGASPEMLVRVEDGVVETDPIAGTRPLGETPAETKAYASELQQSPKERAEHAMLVDLARNDVGQVAAPGTVTVPSFMQVERYSHVQHMVSRVAGELADGEDALDALNALFPAGTVSGAPKIRAMEIITELENQPRGPYAGCIGYLALNGNLDSAITIRSAVARDDTLQVQAGAGIVADSSPDEEYEETQAKGDAMLAALRGEGEWT